MRSGRNGINPLVQQNVEQVRTLVERERLQGGPLRRIERLGFPANMRSPESSNFGVARLDHDFGSKWHFDA